MMEETNVNPVDEFEPIIGIIANPHPDDDDSSGKAYIYHTHIASIEENGAKVIPILPWNTKCEIEIILTKINGVLMQGGSRHLDLDKPFEKFNKFILDCVIEYNLRNGKDNPLPLWCTCQGIELLYAILYNNVNVLSKFNSWNYFIPMIYDIDIIKSSKMFSLFHENDLNIFKTDNCTVHLHNYGINLNIDDHYKISDEYKDIVNLKVISHAYDRDGVPFIGNAEDERLNIFALIFHPEQIPYNYCLSIFDHLYNSDNCMINIKLEKAFVEISKHNNNRFESYEEIKKYGLIENSARLSYENFKTSDEDYIYEFLIFQR